MSYVVVPRLAARGDEAVAPHPPVGGSSLIPLARGHELEDVLHGILEAQLGVMESTKGLDAGAGGGSFGRHGMMRLGRTAAA